ncbi:hypothetical protein L208DRAFT_1249575 [Tricholoma matsutake]|nr:hypothetical protein L208DRAFT_1249575 [Tricholoma matsutake 945]
MISTWLLHHSAFYLGQVPNITKLLRFEQPSSLSSLSPSIQLSCVIHSGATEWHTHSICLTGCIWVVFTGPVHRTKKKIETGLNWTRKDWTRGLFMDWSFIF